MEDNTFRTCVEIFLAEKKVHWDKDGGRILLGDNIRKGLGGGGVILLPIRFQCFEVWISAALPFVHIYLTICKYTEFILAQNSTYAWPSRTQPLRKSVSVCTAFKCITWNGQSSSSKSSALMFKWCTSIKNWQWYRSQLYVKFILAHFAIIG